MARPAAFLLAAVLAACAAPSPFQWWKEGASKAEVEDARAQCKEEARAYGFLDLPEKSERVPTARGERYSSLEARTARREADVFGDCMRAKGFSLVAPEEGAD